MWNWIPKDENKPSSVYPEATHIGKSIVIKGEVSGSENVYVAGEPARIRRFTILPSVLAKVLEQGHDRSAADAGLYEP